MRRGRRKGGSRERVFGCDLMEHLTSSAQDVPQVLRSCSEFIEEHGIVDGIYRLSGVSSNTQRLRSEFDTEGSPDLCKEVYLQDIHCVSSLCKAYFRELPNPLLTYELYDRFADAVAVQLEDERLVKIRDVLTNLPAPHYRTLEFLMRHLVKMSTFAAQTNMHSRNLAIVWAPNLLRSKDIESTGFNGTAAFMEVRVQSIVVEFILTHVPDLFPETDAPMERRKSLPSPSILSTQDDHFFKSLPLQCPGNLSPGDGPPPMRPYHAIIDGTDKRKGSLKGRKWKSIFNLGGRLHDPRKKNKYCPKDKEKTSLRPAKSMDSLSSGPYAVDDSKHPSALPLVLSAASGSSEGVASAGGGVSSGYAVTYRRTGGAQVSMVSGGTPGTYNRLDSGAGANTAETAERGVARSPGLTNKAERRAGIHISGPFSVTVPLHITSGLALGVLHGGWGDKEQSREEEDENQDENPTESSESGENQLHCGNEVTETKEEEELSSREEKEEDQKPNQEETVGDSKPKARDETTEEDYMDMRGHVQQAPVSPLYEDMDQDLPMDLQALEAFGFLDSMDSSANNQVEFSVEAPCFEVEYEEEEDGDHQTTSCPSQNCTVDCETPADKNSLSLTNRSLPGKSHSLPYKSRPFLPALSLSSSSDDEYNPSDDDEDEESDKGSEYEDMFCKSLPDFHGLSWTAIGGDSNQSEASVKKQHTPPPENSKDVSQSEDRIPPENSEAIGQSEDTIPPENTEDVCQSEDTILPENRDAGQSEDTIPPENTEDVGQSEDTIPPENRDAGQSEDTIPPENTEDVGQSEDMPSPENTQDVGQSEDSIPLENCEEVGQSEDAIPPASALTDRSDSAFAEERDSEDNLTLTGADDPESEASGEDTYFGPDSPPLSPEPEQNGAKDHLVQSQEPDADHIPLAPEEEEEESGKSRENEGNSECENITDEGKCEEECSDEKEEKQTTERKEELEEKSEECEEENIKDGEQDGNEAERRDLEENNGECEENASEGDNKAERCEDLEENIEQCEGEEENAKGESVDEFSDEKEEEKSTENEVNSEIENITNEGKSDEECSDEKEAEKDEKTTERKEDLEESGEDDGNEEEKEDLEDISGEFEDVNKAERELDLEETERESRSPEGNAEDPNESDSEPIHSESSPKPILRKSANQTKAVPVVPPKPQNSRLTALNLRKQMQHRIMDADEEIDKKQTGENGPSEAESSEPSGRRGTWDGGADWRRDAEKRNSGISICFDEAVARATERRSRERESKN